MIHPTAVIHPKAKLDSTVRVGPFVVIDEAVEIGAGCVIGPHVYITGVTRIGRENQFHAGCVIGDAPQDLKYNGAPTGLRIGDKNVFREHFTAHRSTKVGEETVIGSNNFIMQHSHVAHNCVVGDNVILASGALLGGHAVVQDRAFISGNCLVHQFVRVGTLAMMQGGSAISMDLPPFTIASEVRGNSMCGLNIVGLRRAGVGSEERLELKKLYRELFRSGENLREALSQSQTKFKSAAARTMMDFVASAKRGVCSDIGGGARETVDE
ncbi:MAG TPA: acyl-ACP--UDP-N-acetylglucosamine O-acyltransferase [Verrucomicrobiae bacterium]|nr:acyl-ACP--UDP-N-acetylglucosamine O-acyltransferase [Verrucomicrobiae bacterium]